MLLEEVIEEYGSHLEAKHSNPHPLGPRWDIYYDGVLATPRTKAISDRYKDKSEVPPVGVFFSSTLYDGDFPTRSPYPTNGDMGKTYWRVAVPIRQCNLDRCSLFCVNKYANKVLLAFVPNEDQDKVSWFKAKEGDNVKEIDKGNNEYMFFKESWYSPKVPCPDEKYEKWIKVFLPFDVDIRNAVWDKVRKTSGV